MGDNAETIAWDEIDAWRRTGGNSRLAFSLKERLMVGAASLLFRFTGRLVWTTTRWEVDDPVDVCGDMLSGRKNYILACWHNRLIGVTLFLGNTVCRRNFNARVGPMVSESLDGEMIARCVRDLGGENVRGSSSRRGAEALRDGIEEVRRGLNIVVTADGPKGPRYELKPGVVMLAKLSGAPIVPVMWSCDHTAQFHRSWDQLLVPLPRARLNFRLGEPFTVPADADARGIARARRELEAQMGQMTRDADLKTAITWQIPKPKAGERLKKRKVITVAADKRM
ncbi:MAG: lysophospholipid acyltransferase family protein [Planctomycetes bacterium]|nr:lysophospholipid acyltransferase family protein [Planctomycetota bacterium]